MTDTTQQRTPQSAVKKSHQLREQMVDLKCKIPASVKRRIIAISRETGKTQSAVVLAMFERAQVYYAAFGKVDNEDDI